MYIQYSYFFVYSIERNKIQISFCLKESWQEQALTAILRTFKAKQRLDERFCGLVVQEKYAKRFVDECAEQRKLMELRSKALKFLVPGERICLLSASGTSTRKVVAVLEFNYCTKIAIGELGHYEGLHRVTTQELDAFVGQVLLAKETLTCMVGNSALWKPSTRR